jgi:hypothetical protein
MASLPCLAPPWVEKLRGVPVTPYQPFFIRAAAAGLHSPLALAMEPGGGSHG